MKPNSEQLDGLSAEEKRALLAELLKKKVRSSKAVYPLSRNQQSLWFLHQLMPESPAYHVAFTARVCSEINLPALKRALQVLINRHSVLRTTFTLQADEPVQEVHSHHELHFEGVDASTWSEAELTEQVIAAYNRPFDLEHGPIFRATLFTRSATDHVLLLTIHHIAFDGWSAWIFLDELRTVYTAETNGRSAALPALVQEYSDYVDWQAKMLAGVEGERLWAYWQQQLGGDLPALNLPTDRPRPPLQTDRGASHNFVLHERLTTQIKELAKERGTTLYTVLLAAFNVLLYRYTDQKDILVGSPVSGRSRPEFAGLVGDFINMVVLRAYFSDNPSFTTFLGQMRETVLGALAHQDFPFPLLVERIIPNRDSSRSPIFQVTFDLQRMQRSEDLAGLFLPERRGGQVNLGGLVLESFPMPQQEGQFDLSLQMAEVKDSLLGNFKYNTDLFDAATIARLEQHFQVLLEGIVAAPEQRLSDLPLLTVAERQQLLVEWNKTEIDYPQDQCVHQLFEAQVAQTPEAIAVIFEDKQLTYQELNERANRLARHLQTLGVGPDTLVGIYMERSLDMIVGLLGVLKAGGAYVPLDPAFPRDRLAFMLADAQAAVLLTQQNLAAEITKPDHTQTVCLDSDWDSIMPQSPANLSSQAQPDNLMYVIYTSGSTGKPKGVQIEHRSVVNFLTTMRQEPGLTREDVLLSVTTLSFDISILEIFLTLTTGARLVLVSRATAVDGAQLLSQLTNSNVTVMQATPTTWRMLIEAGWADNTGLKILCGGEALPHDLANQLLQRCAYLWNVYGPTETTIWSTSYLIQSMEAPLLIGRPIGNTQCYILDAQLLPVPIGLPGELYIGGDGLARGYLNRPELTQEKFVPNPFKPGARLYRTGDLARYLPDGNIDFLGRMDHQVKIRGFRIELGEIEAVLTQHPDLRAAVVIVREDRPGDKRLVAYLIANQPDVPAASDLRTFIRKTLPDYMVPSAFVFVEAYPLTPNKKIDRKALPAPDQIKNEVDSNFVAPSTPTEKLLAEIWSEVLGVEQVGISDNFFDLGGHSLLSAKVVAKLEQKTGSKLPLAYFGYQTLGQLAASCDVQTDLPQLSEVSNITGSGLHNGDQTTVKTGLSEPGEINPKSSPKTAFEPFFFGVPDRQLFGCYHAPQVEAKRDSAVVICYPMGQEYIRSHRAYQQLAIRLARMGFHVLRFDYSGCGDSYGEADEGHFDQWLGDISLAINEIKNRSGLQQVTLVGLRLGAALAMLASLQHSEVVNLVLWEPIINGKAYLEELTQQHQEAIWRFPIPLKNYVASNPPTELMGLPLTQALAVNLGELDLLAARQKTAKKFLIIEGQTEGSAEPLRGHLESLDVAVTYRFVPSFAIWIEDPDKGLVPHQSLQNIVSWISEVSA